jgi:sec-independent protein translocase protein TatA
MGGLSIWHWLVVGVIVMLLFGKGRFSDMMGDVAKGIKSFKKGMSEDDEAAKPQPPARLRAQEPLDPNSDRELQPMRDDRPQG